MRVENESPCPNLSRDKLLSIFNILFFYKHISRCSDKLDCWFALCRGLDKKILKIKINIQALLIFLVEINFKLCKG